MTFFKTVIHPVIEYGSTVWQANITNEQTHRLDAIQRRAQIIISQTAGLVNLTPLKSRFDSRAKHFFKSLLSPTNCLHDNLPAELYEK